MVLNRNTQDAPNAVKAQVNKVAKKAPWTGETDSKYEMMFCNKAFCLIFQREQIYVFLCILYLSDQKLFETICALFCNYEGRNL